MANSSVVGTLRAILSADTAEFSVAMKKAAAASEEMAADIKKASDACAAAGVRFSSVTRLISDFQGHLEKRKAEEFAIAIESIGGAAKLSETELRRASAVFADWTSKAGAIGEKVSPAVQKVTADIEKLTKVGQGTSGIIGDIRGAFANLGPSVLAAAGGFATALISVEALTQGLKAAVQFVKESINQYLEAEKAQRKLTAALEAQRTATPETIKAYKELANQFQRTSVFTDDLIVEMQAMLVTVGNVMPRDMERALDAATNLASSPYFNGDLRGATLAISKAFEDNFTALKKMGIEIDETRVKSEGMAHVLDAVQAKFGGQREAELRSFSGQIENLGNQFGELQETIGGVIVQSPIVQNAFLLLRLEIEKLKFELDFVIGSMKLLAKIPGPHREAFAALV
jgi:hypothetical protein